ncbi:MAG TPA: hypothetical protein VLX91_15495 [Candidatus Acidoferrales bacterium]|nr:hypothetical protein [Candidatus Acidoferrales bacterium]
MAAGSEMLKAAFVRILVVGGIVIVTSYVTFGSIAFEPLSLWFEFVVNGVTITLAYAALMSGRVWNVVVAEMLWCAFTLLVVPLPYGHRGNFVMVTSNVIALTLAVYLYILVVNRHIVNVPILRLIVAVLLVGLAHAVVVIFLPLAGVEVWLHPGRVLEWSILYVKNGMAIGIICAIGMELSEYLINLIVAHRERVC